MRRFQRPLYSRCYARLSEKAEIRGVSALRDQLLYGLSGQVVEVGAGNGLNFAHYPADVGEVLAVEPDDFLRERARRVVESASVPVRFVSADANDLPLPDASRDAAVVSLVLCTVQDPNRVVAEIRRVLRPGGELRFYEHVRHPSPRMALVQDAVTPLWQRVFGGCHPNRDLEQVIASGGFEITDLARFFLAPSRFDPTAPHLLGRALRRPSEENRPS